MYGSIIMVPPLPPAHYSPAAGWRWPLDVVADVGLVHLHIVERMDASLLPIRMDTIEIQVDSIGFVQSPQYMDKAERNNLPLAFWNASDKSRHAHAKKPPHYLFIDHKADKIRIDK